MPKTLLLADDSVTIQKVVGITFANEDVELVTVDNGDDALVRAREVQPDIVLADVSMPGLNGYALCAELKRDPGLQRIPVLLLTGTLLGGLAWHANRRSWLARIAFSVNGLLLAGLIWLLSMMRW